MNGNFEVHPIGTATEMRLARELVAVIEQMTDQFGEGIVPYNVFKAYSELHDHYVTQLEAENL